MNIAVNMYKSSAQDTLIKTNEVLLKERDKWLHFANPHLVVTVQKLEDALPALHEIEQLIKVNEWHAAGFVSYEAASAFHDALHIRAGPPVESGVEAGSAEFPFLWFGLYSSPGVMSLPKPEKPKEILNWEPSIDREAYNAAIEKIRNYIVDRRTYQVNYTMRLRGDLRSSAWDFFLHLAQSQNHHAAYIDLGRYFVCSASPELFFQLKGETITCRPMKGTVKRGRTTFEDEAQSQWLTNAEKNRAENVMIVDMVSN